jgi:hypothetical protein
VGVVGCPANQPRSHGPQVLTPDRPPRSPGISDVSIADSQVAGQHRVGRDVAELLGQLPGRLADLQYQLLH